MAPKSAKNPARLVKLSELARMSGVPRPTIKHYLRRGLLPGPAKRTSRNMAYYDARLAARVRTIKQLQRTRSLSLDAISAVLEPAPSSAIRRDLDADRQRLLGRQAVAEPVAAAGGPVELTRSEVLAALDVSADDLAELQRTGLAHPSAVSGTEPTYSGADLEVLEVLHDARRGGLGPLFSVSALESYADALRGVVAEEMETLRGHLAQGTQPPEVSLAELVRRATELGERMLVALRDKIAVREFGALLRGPGDPGDEPQG